MIFLRYNFFQKLNIALAVNFCPKLGHLDRFKSFTTFLIKEIYFIPDTKIKTGTNSATKTQLGY